MWGAEPCSPEPPCDSCTCPRQPCTDFFAEDLIEGSEKVREEGLEGKNRGAELASSWQELPIGMQK